MCILTTPNHTHFLARSPQNWQNHPCIGISSIEVSKQKLCISTSCHVYNKTMHLYIVPCLQQNYAPLHRAMSTSKLCTSTSCHVYNKTMHLYNVPCLQQNFASLHHAMSTTKLCTSTSCHVYNKTMHLYIVPCLQQNYAPLHRAMSTSKLQKEIHPGATLSQERRDSVCSP